jgi:hypothetical protein
MAQKFPTLQRRIGLLALGAALALGGLWTMSVGAQAVQSDDDPLALFAETMPVFSSPRCVNCHGATNPATDTNHEGGQVDFAKDAHGDMAFDATGACLECHTAAPPPWRLAPRNMSLVGKDTLTLCRQMRSVNGLKDPGNRQKFIDHLNEDPLIALGFVGQGAIGEDSAFAPITPEPPPMGQGEFIAAAQRWLTDGNAACSSKWNGTITETTNASESVLSRAVRTETRITITVVDSKASADVHWQMTDFTDVKTRECATYVHHTFSSDATKLPVDLTIVLNTPALPTGPITLPEGITLPPGATLPGFTLPPGMTLPPGIVGVPTGGPFFMYSGALVKGNHHTDLRTLPGCKRVVTDEAHPYTMTGALIQATVDPNDPDHLVGENVVQDRTGKTVYRWDLRRGD